MTNCHKCGQPMQSEYSACGCKAITVSTDSRAFFLVGLAVFVRANGDVRLELNDPRVAASILITKSQALDLARLLLVDAEAQEAA
jgi:hypothetical protein